MAPLLDPPMVFASNTHVLPSVYRTAGPKYFELYHPNYKIQPDWNLVKHDPQYVHVSSYPMFFWEVLKSCESLSIALE